MNFTSGGVDLTQETLKRGSFSAYVSTSLHISEIISNIVGAIILTIGVFKALFLLRKFNFKTEKNSERVMILARLEISESVLLGLSFMLVADVIKTIRVPNLIQLVRLSLLIGIRQLLTYYLDKEHSELKQLKSEIISS